MEKKSHHRDTEDTEEEELIGRKAGGTGIQVRVHDTSLQNQRHAT
jgi:hypothetical protein